ncbi:MAG: hypothetical protein KC656_21150 [Myxococcales bacterium]|nr:hypothetical protein [Myxococcales bacterium]
MALALIGLAFAADCPDPSGPLRSAKDDAMGLFLADAQRSIQQAVDALGCAEPADPEVLGRLWQIQAIVWRLGNDPREAEAWAAARRTPTPFDPDFGPDAQAAFEAAGDAAPVKLVVRGAGPDESTWLDGASWAGEPVPAGLHLLQVGPGPARVSRVVRVVEDGAVSVPEAPVVDRITEATPLGPEEPPPVDRGPPPPDEVLARLPPDLRDAYTWPLHLQGPRLADASDTIVRGRHLTHLANAAPGGDVLVRERRKAATTMVGSGVLAATAGYVTYLLAWDALVGKNSPYSSGAAITAAGFGVVFATSGTRAWATRRTHTRALRAAVAEAL